MPRFVNSSRAPWQISDDGRQLDVGAVAELDPASAWVERGVATGALTQLPDPTPAEQPARSKESR